MATLFSDFLRELRVRHTTTYSDTRFAEMPFQSMFGLANLLKEYGVGTAGIRVEEGSRVAALKALPLPLLADTADGFAIVCARDGDTVRYLSRTKQFTVPVEEMAGAWNGVALLAATDADSGEPEYGRHHLAELANHAKGMVMWVLIAALTAFAFWKSGLYAVWSAWPILLLDCVGLVLSWMLVQKALGIGNRAADAVCSVLEEGGCDAIAKSEAASFMGIFKWSEVGLAYFSVSIAALLMFPQTLPALAAINILCLPYTFWSILYQKFKAKTWCTLCVSVQAVLWLLFVCYLLGDWTRQCLPLHIDFWALAIAYGAALLTINRFDTALARLIPKKDD